MKRLIAAVVLLSLVAAAVRVHGETPLKLGVLAYRPEPQTMAQWRPLAAYLQATLRRPVELAVYDHAGLSIAAARRAVDVVMTTPNHFILLQHTSGLSAPLATLVSREGPHELSAYGGVIFTRADRGDITALPDLSGKRIAAASLDAFGGYHMQALELVEAGIALPAGDRLLLTGQPHDRVIEAVLARRADAGFTRAGILESLAREGKLDPTRVKVINRQNLAAYPYTLSTRLYPEWPVAVMPQVDQELAGRLAAALFLLPPDVFKEAAPGIRGFTTPANYDGVENLMRRLRLSPFDRVPEITPADLWRRYSSWLVTVAALLLLLAGTSAGLVFLYRRSRRAYHELERLADKEKKTLASLAESEAKIRQIVDTAREGIWVLGPDAATIFANARMAEMLGYGAGELIGRPFDDFMFEEDLSDHREKMKARRNGLSETYERRFRRKDGGGIWTLASATPLFDEARRFSGSFAMFTDITERRRNDAVNASRLHLIQFSLTHSLDDLLEETLNETEKLTGSLIGFYHFVEADQKYLTLQAWSTRTKTEFCKAAGKGLHYAVNEAGVWTDCVQQRKPVVHNDYASLPHRKGMPEGHAAVVRELVVPVFRGGNISAILGVGNKGGDYDEKDVEAVSLIADLAWEIAERKRTEEALKNSEERFRRLAENARDAIYRMSLPDGKYEYMSPASVDLFGYAPELFYASPQIRERILHPGWRGYFEEQWAKLLRGDMPPTYEYQIVHKSGEVRWVNQRNILVRDAGRIVAIEGIVTDITERKKSEERLRNLNAELEQRVKERTAELERKNAELEKLNKVFVGRELRMAELKEKLRKLDSN